MERFIMIDGCFVCAREMMLLLFCGDGGGRVSMMLLVKLANTYDMNSSMHNSARRPRHHGSRMLLVVGTVGSEEHDIRQT